MFQSQSSKESIGEERTRGPMLCDNLLEYLEVPGAWIQDQDSRLFEPVAENPERLRRRHRADPIA